MNFKTMTTEQLQTRAAAILEEMDKPNADLNALQAEARGINQELTERRNAENQRNEIRSAVAGAQIGHQVRSFDPAPAAEKKYDASSPEYRSAWLKYHATQNGIRILGDWTEEERTAFTVTTQNTAVLVPTVIQDRIVELVESMAPMYADSTNTGFAQGFGVPRHKAILAGDAAATEEGAANPDDEEDSFDLLELDGCEVKKHAVQTRKMIFKSLNAYEDWLVQHLAARIAVGKEAVIMARLDGTTPTGGKQITGSGIDSVNILTGQAYTDAAIRGIFAQMKGQGQRVIYANNATIWNKLVGIEDGEHRKLFVPNSMVDPVVQGRIYGATVSLDENLSDNVVYFGTKGSLLTNDYDRLTISSFTEPKTFREIKSAYSLFDAGLENPKSWVKATFTP